LWLFARALLAFLVCPAVVALLVPWLLAGLASPKRPFSALGLIPLIPGIGLLIWCVGAFYAKGKGTLAPWDPPQQLVDTGVYGVSRNPMYVAVVLILCGWAIGFRSPGLAVYACVIAAAFHLRVVLGEEPWLAERHGEDWDRYKARVPRWVGSRRARRGQAPGSRS
jgi:protein-S-isoprenylcysteine O-methyltransferase Ste14